MHPAPVSVTVRGLVAIVAGSDNVLMPVFGGIATVTIPLPVPPVGVAPSPVAVHVHDASEGVTVISALVLLQARPSASTG